MKFAIIDYGASNMFSLMAALKRIGVNINIIVKERDLDEYSAIILPGVGNFSVASNVILKFKNSIIKSIMNGTPLFGICLGLQLFFETSEEGEGEGLSLIKGKVIKFPNNIKIPHMGWNLVIPQNRSKLLSNIDGKIWVYFAHSYFPQPEDKSVIKGITIYGIQFPSVIEDNNVFGTQFHPEKSGTTGQVILENFVNIVKR
ncbi:MAG: imidazole glycerol phosphate synthase subunit HisH [Thermoprotei archaeon]|jgi:glutamine amidotransferase